MIVLLTLLLAFRISGAQPVNPEVLQSPDDDKIYAATDVDVKAKIKNGLDELPVRNSDCPPSVHVIVKVVLRKSGKVTDITIVKSSGCSYDQEAIRAVSKLKFDPALKGGQPVSQYSQLEYTTEPSNWPRRATGPKSANDQALSYGLLLDLSGTKENLVHITAAAKAIINSNIPPDQTFIVRFIGPDKIQNLQDFSADKSTLLETLDELKVDGGRAAIVDAVYVSAQHLLKQTTGSNTQRALVLITHGDEQSSFYKLDQLLSALREHHVRVYILVYVEQGTKRYKKAMEFINKLARESGGEAIIAKRAEELEAKAAEVVALLRRRK